MSPETCRADLKRSINRICCKLLVTYIVVVLTHGLTNINYFKTVSKYKQPVIQQKGSQFDTIFSPKSRLAFLKNEITCQFQATILILYRGADKFLARPGRKQGNVSVIMARISFGALPCRKKKTS